MKKIVTSLFITLLVSGCVRDDYFGLSQRKDIKSFKIEGQAGNTSIDTDSLKVSVPVPPLFDVTRIAASEITISNMASITPGVGDSLDFTEPQVYSVTAEDGSLANWTVTLTRQGPEVQLDNSNFDDWYDAGGYPEPGDGSQDVWSTANKGLSLVGGYNTEPVADNDGEFYVKMTSVRAPALVRMAAATLFTGTFTDGFPSVTDPKSNVNFGVPFSAQPLGFRVSYKYTPGDSFEDAKGNPLNGDDSCDIYVLLEKWTGEGENLKKLRVATAWHRSSAVITDWTDLSLDFIYGELPGPEDYEVPADGYAEDGTTPTHISVVFSSSALGDEFVGAIGSVLEVDDFALVYQ